MSQKIKPLDLGRRSDLSEMMNAVPKAESRFDQDFNDLLIRESLIDHNHNFK